MPKAIWNGTVLAENDRCEVVEETSVLASILATG